MPLDLQTNCREFIRDAGLICGFQQPGSKFAVHLDGGTDDLFGDLIDSSSMGGSVLRPD